jgi:hypothetical protein
MGKLKRYGRICLGVVLLVMVTMSSQAQEDTTVVADTITTAIGDSKDLVDVATDETTPDYFVEKSAWTDTAIGQTRHLADTAIKRMQQDPDFWYANEAIEKKKEQKDYKPVGQRTWFKTVIWLVIIGGFLAFIIWYLGESNVRLFRKRAKGAEETPVSDEIPEDIFAINYQKEIDKAAGAGNYRLAVRLMFLRLLKTLAEKNVIAYKQDRTNFDYLLQLHATRYYNDFFRITRNYEYSWYGKFEISSNAYTVIKSDFENLAKQI